MEFRGFKVLTNDRAGDRTVHCMHKHMRAQAHVHRRASPSLPLAYTLAANTYLLLCYLRAAVIVHMRHRLSKYDEQNLKKCVCGGGWVDTNKTSRGGGGGGGSGSPQQALAESAVFAGSEWHQVSGSFKYKSTKVPSKRLPLCCDKKEGDCRRVRSERGVSELAD